MNKDNSNTENKHIKFIKSPVKIFLMICGVLIIALVGSLYFIGYLMLDVPLCNNWHTGMTKQEKIFLSVKTANEQSLLRFEKVIPDTGKKRFDIEKQIPYKEADIILKEQPDCCHLYSQDSVDTDYKNEDIKIGDEGVVYLNYIGKYVDINGDVHVARISEYGNFNFCKK